MVKDTRAPGSADAIRALSQPVPLAVKADREGNPVSVRLKGRWLKVESIADRWRIDDEWWRSDPVTRVYYECMVDQGLKVAVFHDLVAGQWFQQRA